MNLRTVLPLAALIVCVGCATVGTKIDASSVNLLKVGVTSKADAIALLGNPRTVSETSNGTSMLIWAYAHVQTFGSHESSSVVLTFGADGLLTGKTSTATTVNPG